MEKAKIIAIGLLIVLGFYPSLAYSTDGWEANLNVKARTAENRLSFGQKADATDGDDGFYDVTAMLNGDIKAYFKSADKTYWRDIKAEEGGIKRWVLEIGCSLEKEFVTLTWKPSAFPRSAKAVLLDDSGGFLVDMKSESSYNYVNDGSRVFIIEIQQQ